MNNTKKVTFCAILAALSTVIMMVSYFPYLTYAVPAIAGLCMMVVVIELNCKWALLSYLSAAFLTFLFAELESKLLFITFFGFYPILKSIIERIRKPVVEWVLKYAVFNACVIATYFVFAKFILLSFDDMGPLADYAEIILLAMGNVVFLFYDIAVSRIAGVYYEKLHTRIVRLMK